MSKYLIFVGLFIFFSCSMKNGNFKFKCVDINKVKGIYDISFEYSKAAYKGETSLISVNYKVDSSISECFNFTFYFKGTNDTLIEEGTIEGNINYTSRGLKKYLESNGKLMLRVTNNCNHLVNVFNIDYEELNENFKLMGH